MPLRPEVIKILSREQETPKLAELRQRLQDLVKMSRNVMKDYYPLWDANDRVYRGERTLDESDKKAIKRNEPGKVFVPMTHTQIQTFVSFATMLLTQRDFFYELGGSGVEDERPAKLAQAVLQRDLEHNKFTGVLLPQFLTDVGRFGLGVFKSHWKRDTCPVQQTVPDPNWQPVPNLPTAQQPPMIQQWVDVTKYLGNNIEVISPYRWFPDTRLPLTRYRDGEFCADENEYSRSKLAMLERQGEIAGLEHIPTMPDDAFQDRRMTVITRATENDPQINPDDARHYVLVTEVEMRLNPAKTEIDDGVFLDPELDAEIICLVWIANDGRIIKIQDAGYNHNEFLHDAAQFFNDQNRFCNFGIAELLAPMQDILDWLMNSRVTNVRKVIQNQLIVDPKNIELQDLKDRNPVIRLRSSVQEGLSIDMFIKQLQVTDVTTGHITDMGVVKNFGQEATGIADNLMGQFNEGRRSAREVSNVNANAAARVVVPIKGLWDSAFLPLGKKLLSNLRQGLDEQQLVRIIGIQRYLENRDAVAAFLPLDKSQLVGDYDFLVFEATLPSQRTAIAQAILSLGDTLIKQPMAAVALQLDPRLLVQEWLELQGVRNAERFRLTPERLGEIMQMVGLVRNQGNAPVPPGQG